MSDPLDGSVRGDGDNWMLFDRETPDGYPLVVLARTGNSLCDRAVRDAIVTVVHCRADIALINERGMPQNSDCIYPIEDGLAHELEASGVTVFHVASVTGDGERRLIYAHQKRLDFQPLLTRFKPDGYALSVSQPADRDALIELTTPTDLDRQLSGDMGVIAHLEENGDDGLVPRKADFWFYGEKAGLDDLISELEPWGYSIDHWLDDPVGVVLATEMAVNFETLREVTPVLIATAERHGVTYDGWETFIVGRAQSDPEPKAHRQSFLAKLFGGKN